MSKPPFNSQMSDDQIHDQIVSRDMVSVISLYGRNPVPRRTDIELQRAPIDARHIAAKAMTTNRWQYKACHGVANKHRLIPYECVMVVASPDGRAAEWHRLIPPSELPFLNKKHAARWALLAYPASCAHALYFEQSSTPWGYRQLRMSHRSGVHEAYFRTLHASVLGYDAAIRDQLIVELSELDARLVMEASDDLLMAAAAIAQLGDEVAATQMLKGRPVFGLQPATRV